MFKLYFLMLNQHSNFDSFMQGKLYRFYCNNQSLWFSCKQLIYNVMHENAVYTSSSVTQV